LKKLLCQDHYDDERDKTVFYNTTPDLQDQDQDRSVQNQDQDRISLVSDRSFPIRPTVSDLITGTYTSMECKTASELILEWG